MLEQARFTNSLGNGSWWVVWTWRQFCRGHLLVAQVLPSRGRERCQFPIFRDRKQRQRSVILIRIESNAAALFVQLFSLGQSFYIRHTKTVAPAVPCNRAG